MIFGKNKAHLAVIGLGYVGLPLALEFAKKRKVIGYDINEKWISELKNSFDNNPYQAVERDFAFIFDSHVKSYEILNSIKKAEKELINDLFIFDVYEGKNIPKGKKSIAIKIILQPKKSTFTDEEIENISQKIIDKIGKETGGKIRK